MKVGLLLLCFGSWLPGSYNTRAQPATPPATHGHVFNPKTLGLRLNRAKQISLDGAPAGRQQLAPYTITDFNTYMGALYTVALENPNPMQPKDWPRTISIDFLHFSPKIKRISDAQKKQLMDSGRKGAQAFLTRQPARK
jgi:NTE family protein